MEKSKSNKAKILSEITLMEDLLETLIEKNEQELYNLRITNLKKRILLEELQKIEKSQNNY